MQSSAAGDFPAPLAPSGLPTDDGQSPRQPNANAASSEGAPTSFRAYMPFDRSTISSQQRRGGNLVLFVKPNESESEAASRVPAFTSVPQPQQPQANGGGVVSEVGSFSEEADETVSGAAEKPLAIGASALTGAVGSVGSVATGVARKPLLIAALVLVYFILLDIVLLRGNERLNRVLRRMRAAEDDALILLSASLVRQTAEAKRELRDAVAKGTGSDARGGLEMAQRKVRALEKVCNRSISRLHAALMFPGSVDDLFFLIEAHATYDDMLRDLAVHELDWATTVMAGHVVQTGGGVVEELQIRAPGAGGPVAHSPAAHGSESPPTEEGRTDAALNSLRNVRLHRVREGVAPDTPASNSYSQRGYTGARGTTDWRRQAGSAKRFASLLRGATKVAGGVLAILRLKYIAVMLICVMLSAVVRMG
ncbi:hypothetical protein LSCM1_03451 [Leishmania martiniquensis]|uniref:Uncharacterized protein n=1 Tax=Leishmania martiniquensis TaxID=1580590 RepID=A0A836H586_9TRYP|nr:hypothetical protein LSCM1_03451 [Leishmania martiniquensis]